MLADQAVAMVGVPPGRPDLAVVLGALGRGGELPAATGHMVQTPWLQAAAAMAGDDFEGAADGYAQIGSLPDEAFARLRAAERLLGGGQQPKAARSCSVPWLCSARSAPPPTCDRPWRCASTPLLDRPHRGVSPSTSGSTREVGVWFGSPHRLEPWVAPIVVELWSDGGRVSLRLPSARRRAARDGPKRAGTPSDGGSCRQAVCARHAR